MIRPIAQFQIALMTLTRLPAGQVRGEVPSVAQSVWAFPIVGSMVGGLAALGYVASINVGLPPSLAAFLALGLGVFATGAIHEDGLADMADGLGGGHTRERKLEIMRDSRIGSYGAVALILSLAVRATAIPLVAEPAVALICLAAFSRALMPILMWGLPPARPDGLGRGAGKVSTSSCLFAIGFGLVALYPLHLVGMWVAIGMLIACALIAAIAKRQVGGQTGDVLGATQQFAEISGWLILAAISENL